MPRIHPSGWRQLEATGAAAREIETLARFEAGLPHGLTVYHGVHWTRIERGHSVFGEIDFAIVSPAGRLLLIEQKSGFLSETPDGLMKKYGPTEKRVAAQMARTVDALKSRYLRAYPGEGLQAEYLLYCPDYTVRHPDMAGIDPARIVDAGRRAELVPLVRKLLPEGEAASPAADRLHRFLGDTLELVPEVGAVAGEAQALYTRLSGGLAAWGRRIECEPQRLRVVGTAGSGKTQLALAVYRDALAAGKRPVYLCYNRPLADHFATIVPAGGEVATYHQLCDRVLRRRGVVPDFGHTDAFRRLEEGFAAAGPDEAWRCDTLIVDEGQDFHAEWRDPLLRLLAPGGAAWWLEDPMQNLYGRALVPLPGWVVLRSDTNYRSPRDILDRLNRIVALDRPVDAGSPLAGAGVEILTYGGTQALIEATKRALTRAIGLGFRRDMIAVVTFRGREHSALTPYDRLGPHALKAFTGRYDLLGSPIHTGGETVIDSVYRFKGRSAPCVVFTEIDFEALDDLATRKLFVGVTRAMMKLILVVSDRAARVLMQRPGPD
jgi:hypothetical protein